MRAGVNVESASSALAYSRRAASISPETANSVASSFLLSAFEYDAELTSSCLSASMASAVRLPRARSRKLKCNLVPRCVSSNCHPELQFRASPPFQPSQHWRVWCARDLLFGLFPPNHTESSSLARFPWGQAVTSYVARPFMHAEAGILRGTSSGMPCRESDLVALAATSRLINAVFSQKRIQLGAAPWMWRGQRNRGRPDAISLITFDLPCRQCQYLSRMIHPRAAVPHRSLSKRPSLTRHMTFKNDPAVCVEIGGSLAIRFTLSFVGFFNCLHYSRVIFVANLWSFPFPHFINGRNLSSCNHKDIFLQLLAGKCISFGNQHHCQE